MDQICLATTPSRVLVASKASSRPQGESHVLLDGCLSVALRTDEGAKNSADEAKGLVPTRYQSQASVAQPGKSRRLLPLETPSEVLLRAT